MTKALHYSALTLLLLYLLFQTGCATTLQRDCATGEELAINELLFFGTAKPLGIVSPEEWQNFLKTSVTLRFPNGFTSWPAQGQWLGNTGAIIQETTYVVDILHPDNNDNETNIKVIMNEYRLRFDQEAVLRAKNHVCSDLVKS